MKRDIYLDNASTTKPYQEVMEKIYNVGLNSYGNPSSLHRKGIDAEKLITEARNNIAKLLRVDNENIYFTSGGTESNNLIIKGIVNKQIKRNPEIITSEIEHPSVKKVCEYYEKQGIVVHYIPVGTNGIVDTDILKEKVNNHTAVVSIMTVNNEIGTIQPINQVGFWLKNNYPDIVFHTDFVQGIGKIKNIPKNVDAMSVSGHKIHGPKGVGALYVRKGINFEPLILGGGQEKNIRSGTQNTIGIAGMGEAAKIILENENKNQSSMLKYKQTFINKLQSQVEDFIINGNYPESSPYILNLSFKGIKGEVLLHDLERKGIYVSTGSACSSNKKTNSYVLNSIKVDKEYIEGTVRFSFSEFNVLEEIDEVVSEIKASVDMLRLLIRRT
jgi:cysteine desulfurase